ncbi:MAG: hypothetical protein JEZ06_14705 [Anaerolineaceae bacterium]|nr:hypothetical protein [Anaerolineaceae bacterium]
MILEMTRVQILGLKDDIHKTVKTLHELGCIHIDDIRSAPEIIIPPYIPETETTRKQKEIQILISQINGLLEIFRKYDPDCSSANMEIVTLDEIKIEHQKLMPKITALTASLSERHNEQESLPRYIHSIKKLIPILPPSASLPQNATIGLLINRTHLTKFEVIRNEVLKITTKAEFVSGNIDEALSAILIIIPHEYFNQVDNLVGQKDLSRFRLPSGMEQLSPQASLEELTKNLYEGRKDILHIEKQIRELSQIYYERCENWINVLQNDLQRLEILSYFGQTEKTFTLVGWVPENNFASFKETLEKQIGSNLIIKTLPIPVELEETVPIALQNLQAVRPFETLVNLLSRPRYKGIDPSALMFVFFPLFFGMMLGDVGYGLIIFFLTFLIGKKFGGFASDLIKIIRLGSLWTILFGFLFGELFGTVGEHLGMHALWMDRAKSENLVSLLIISVGVGAAHIILGLVLGIWRAILEKSRHHLLERGGMLLGLSGTFILAAIFTNLLPRSLMTPAVSALIVGMVLLGIPSGKPGFLVGPLEMLGVAGNVLSYMRIAAIGLASVYLAKVANEMAGMSGSLIAGAIIAILIHSLNLVMGLFSPSIHSLRLHYVEFFRKFYDGGGKAYEPFRSQYSIESGK